MAKFLILQSSNKSNIGIIRDYSETYVSPDTIKLTEEEVNEWNTISPMERKFRLEEYRSSNDKKKIFKNAELVERVEESVSDNMPEFEEEEPLNEPINETANDLDTKFIEAISVEMPDELKKSLQAGEQLSDKEYKEIKEQYNPVVKKMVSEQVKEILTPKAKGRPKKNK